MRLLIRIVNRTNLVGGLFEVSLQNLEGESVSFVGPGGRPIDIRRRRFDEDQLTGLRISAGVTLGVLVHTEKISEDYSARLMVTFKSTATLTNWSLGARPREVDVRVQRDPVGGAPVVSAAVVPLGPVPIPEMYRVADPRTGFYRLGVVGGRFFRRRSLDEHASYVATFEIRQLAPRVAPSQGSFP